MNFTQKHLEMLKIKDPDQRLTALNDEIVRLKLLKLQEFDTRKNKQLSSQIAKLNGLVRSSIGTLIAQKGKNIRYKNDELQIKTIDDKIQKLRVMKTKELDSDKILKIKQEISLLRNRLNYFKFKTKRRKYKKEYHLKNKKLLNLLSQLYHHGQDEDKNKLRYIRFKKYYNKMKTEYKKSIKGKLGVSNE